MQTINNRNVVVCDVDDTLIIWDKHSRDLTADLTGRLVIVCPYTSVPYSFTVHQRHVDFLKREYAKGSYIIVWSRSESKWAETVVNALRLENYVNITMSKPIKFIDDKNNTEDVIGTHLFLDKEGHSV